jgi:hypothetical protein
LLTAAAVVALVNIAEYAFIISNTSYKMACEFAHSSSPVREYAGPLKKVNLDFLGTRLEESESSGDADIVLNLRGAKSSGKLIVNLHKSIGVWTVVAATIDEKKIPIPATPHSVP